VDAKAASPPLLRARAHRRTQRGGLPRALGGAARVPAASMSSPRYVELHAHSAFSFLDGASAPEELAQAAATLGHEALALTDHDGVWGALEFAQACTHLGVRPIVGSEMTITPATASPSASSNESFHVTLLVESQEG